jgi:hypothetical protein
LGDALSGQDISEERLQALFHQLAKYAQHHFHDEEQMMRDLGLDPAKVNPNGSGISLGHPIGATGALITVKALYELQRIQGRYALATMCIGGGQGIAAVFERT